MAERGSCTADELVNRFPCLHCLSESDLQALLMYLWMYLFSAEDDLDEVLATVKCIDCISEKQKLESEVAIMIDALINDENVTPASVMEIVKCFACLSKSQKESVILYFKCIFWGLFLQT